MAAVWYYLRISFSNISLFLFYLLHHIGLLLHVTMPYCNVKFLSTPLTCGWRYLYVINLASMSIQNLLLLCCCSSFIVRLPSLPVSKKVVLVVCEWYLGVVLSCMIISAWLQALTSAYALITFVFFSVTQCKLTVFASNSVLCISLHMHRLYFRSLEAF